MNTLHKCRAAFCVFIATAFCCPLGKAASNDPVPIPPRTILTNTPQTTFRNRSVQPPNPASIVLPQSPEATTNFLAWSNATDYAADTHGAVGTNARFHTGTRTRWRATIQRGFIEL